MLVIAVVYVSISLGFLLVFKYNDLYFITTLVGVIIEVDSLATSYKVISIRYLLDCVE